MLDIQNLSKTFNPGTVNEKKALSSLSLHLDEGDFVTIVGSNGAGKSTLFNAIAGSFYADEGSISLAGKDITFMPEHERSRRIGRLFQDPLRGTAPSMTIEENLALAYLRAAHGNPFSRISKKDKEFFAEQLKQLDMGLEDRMKNPVGLLSGGQRQALTLLMATMVPPQLLLLDEHTAALDPATAEKVLDHIEWSCAASTITPVAVFDPVQLEGTTVTRASLCNVSELERLGIGKDRKTELRIIKANKIIPKCIAVVRAEGSYEVPTACPVCGAATEVRISPISGVKTLRCTDPNCPAKHLKRFVRFASKGGLDIDGLSVQTLHEFVNRGYLRDFADLYHLDAHADEIVKLEGFGEKSCANLLAAIEKSRKVDPIHLIFALCIPNIGTDAGKKLIAALGTKGFLSRIESGEGFEDVDGIGVERSNALLNWFADDENKNLFDRLMAELTLEDVAPKQEADGTCKGLSFVITGDVHLFKNRSAFKAYVEQQGGAVTGSVSGKTTYLVSNDGESNSSKTKKAKELGVPILSEEEFVSRFGGPESADSAEVQIGIDTLL